MLTHVAFLFTLVTVNAWYLPGVAPRDYQSMEQVELKVNNLDSTLTQLPYDHYSVAYCKPPAVVETPEGLGEIISGERVQNSAYALYVEKSEKCKLLCEHTLSTEELKQFDEKIRDNYNVNWVIDNIPSATLLDVVEKETDTGREFVSGVTAIKGFSMGYLSDSDGLTYLNNHVAIVIKVHKTENGFRIVGFQVTPTSNNKKCAKSAAFAVSGPTAKAPKPVSFTYDVAWESSDIKWASRWDVYLKGVNPEVRWVSIMNSFVLALCFSGTMASVLIRSLKKDLSRYNALEQLVVEDAEDDEIDDMGWKQVHGDVFRNPKWAFLLVGLAGTGAQLLCMCVITILFACFGLLSPANRGGLMTAFLVLFVLMGIPGGYVAARLHKMMGLEDWKLSAWRVSVTFPGFVFCAFFVVNLFIWSQHSTAAVPFGTLVALLCLWLGVSLPLTLTGAYFGNRAEPIGYPVRVNHLARVIPEQHWVHSSGLSAGLAGTLPFCCVFMELFFIMTSVWEHQFYYMFGILGLLFLILVVVSAEVSVFLSYNLLSNEDYHWWWRSFFASGSSALYFFLYSCYYYTMQMPVFKFVTAVVYFGYSLMAVSAFFVVTGTIGFLASLYFTRAIYGNVKVD